MPAPYSAGSIFLQVFPSFKGVPEQIAREAREWPDRISDGFDEKLEKNTREAGKKAGKALGEELAKGTKDAGKTAGDDYTGAFRESLRRGIASAQRELNTTPLKLTLRDEGIRKTLDKVRQDFKDLDRQVKLGMDSNGALMELRRVLSVIEDVQKKAQNVEVRSNLASLYRDLSAAEKRIQSLSGINIEPDLKIDRQLGVFERRLKAGIKSALNDIPPLTIDDGPAYAQVEALRERLQSLDRDVDLGVDSAQLFAELAAVETAFHELADTAGTMKLRVDGASAFKTVATMRAELESLSRITIEPEIDLDRNVGAFERALKSAVGKALSDIGTIDGLAATDPNFSDAGQRQLMELRRQLEELNGLRLGVDISDDTARLRLTQIRDELEKLQREHWSIRMDADTAAASAALTGVLSAMEAIDGRHVDIDVDVKDAVSAITQLRAIDKETRKAGGTSNDAANSFRAFNIRILGLAALGPLVVPALAAIGGGIAALLPLAAAAGAAIGVLVLGFLGVGDAVKAMGDARKAASKDAQTYERSVRSASEGVADAERSLASARESASRSNAQAAQQVESAERGLRDAQRSSLQAQEELTRARADAAEELEDLRLAVEGGALAERDAVLDLKEAQQELAAARAEGVTGDDLERFILSVDQADLALRRAKETNGDLTAESERWARTGVEGSDRVISAQQRVQEANEGIADAQRALADARDQQSQTAVDGQRAIADAQRALTEAQRTYTESVAETTSAQDKLNDAMNKLGPAGREFATYIDSLRPTFQNLRGLAQEGFLPGLTDWIDSIVSYHGPLLESTVARMGGAIGDMFSQFGTSLRGQEFTAFFQMIERSGPTFVGMMGSVLTNLGQGVASLTVAMEPLAYLFGQWLIQATERFNRWANSLQGSTGLASFFEYVAAITPKVAEFIWNLADALIQVGIALAPYAEGLLDILDDILGWIAALDPTVLGPIAAGLVLVTLSLQAIFGLTALAKSFEAATRLSATAVGRLSSALFGWIAVSVLVGLALVDLYKNSDDFRNAVDSIWDVVQPLADFFGGAFAGVLEFVTGLVSTFSTEIALLVGALVGLKLISVISGALGAFGTSLQRQVADPIRNIRNQIDLLPTTAGVAALNMQDSARRISSTWSEATRNFVIANGGAAGSVGSLRSQFAGLQAVGANAFAGMTRGAQGLVNMLGGPWGVALLAGMVLIGQWMSMTRAAEEQEKKWADALSKGGEAARNAVADYKKEREERNGFEWMKDLDEWTGVTSSIEDAQRAQREYFNGLSPLEQAEMKVAEWTATHADRVATLGKNHEDTRTAQERLTYWTEILKGRQTDLELAISGVNVALLEQQNRAISLAEADIAFAQSTESLAQAQQRVADALRDHGAESREYKDALAALESQQLSTAQAAGRLAESRHSDADANEKQQWANAAILANLIAQEEQYGKLPPRLQELKDSLAETVPATFLATTQMENLGLAVMKIPDDKTIVISGDTPQAQLDRLRELGLTVTQLPDGSFAVTANTDDAARILDEFINQEREIVITAAVRATQHATPGQNNDWASVPGQGGVQGGRASGGVIYGPGSGTSDSILARLSNGEYVIKAASVNKYGLDFLGAVNSGRYQPPAFRNGGPVSLPRFAEGGYVAEYGGTINLSGGAIPELASFWVAAVSTIQQASGMAAQAISQSFLDLRNAILGNFMATGTEAKASWGLMMLAITTEVNRGATAVGLRVASLQAELSLRFGLIRIASVTDWSTMWNELQAVTNNGATNIGLRAGALQNELDLRFAIIRANVVGHTGETMRLVGEAWSRLPDAIAAPVNDIINRVINEGLLGAFNSIVGQLGTGTALTPAPAVKTKLAAGGKVPGYSPNDKADNIPAWLTAGEFVQPVDVVRHYGVDFMEKLRKKELPRYATGGYVGMSNVIKNQFPWARITSTVRPGDPGYHGKGMAIDIGGAAAYPNPTAIKQMLEINRWIAANFSNITELIHTQPGAINLWHGAPHTYNAGTQAEHRNHVHWAMAGALLAGGGNFPGMAGSLGIDPTAVMREAVEKSLKGFGDASPMHKILAEVPRKLSTFMAERLNKMIEEATFAMGDASAATGPALSGNRAANEALVKSMAEARGWGGQWGALRQLIMKESGFNNTAQNPSSTAYGMFQFLNSTWAGTGIAKTSDPRLQTEAGLRYIASRYGGPAAALAFHQRNNWYGEGGEVRANQGTDNGAIIPDLHDMGGWLMPGLNVLMNRTGKPEAVINPQTLDALVSIADRGAGGDGSAIGTLNQYLQQGASPREVAGAVDHAATVARRGGKY